MRELEEAAVERLGNGRSVGGKRTQWEALVNIAQRRQLNLTRLLEATTVDTELALDLQAIEVAEYD